jgi:hypothetical protein
LLCFSNYPHHSTCSQTISLMTEKKDYWVKKSLKIIFDLEVLCFSP